MRSCSASPASTRSRELRKIYEDAIALRTGERFVVDGRQRPLLRALPHDRARRRRRGARDRRTRAAVLRRGDLALVRRRTAAERGHRARGQRGRDRARQAKRSSLACTRRRSRSTPNTTATFNINHAYGTADRAIAYVEQLEDAGADEIMCLIQMGTVPQDVCMETIRQWGETRDPPLPAPRSVKAISLTACRRLHFREHVCVDPWGDVGSRSLGTRQGHAPPGGWRPPRGRARSAMRGRIDRVGGVHECRG